jgi:hypothetical protein
MRRTTLAVAVGLLAALASRGDVAEARGSAEDDLAVVRRAVARNTPSPVQVLPAEDKAPQAEPTEPVVADEAAARKSTPQWLRVRITERGGKSKVAINIPLALARSLGDDVPLHWGCRRHCDGERASVRLGDILRSLDSGQDIVEVDSDDSSVRVWVE